MTVPATTRTLAPDLARGFMLLLIILAHAPLLLVGATPGFATRPIGDAALDRGVDAMLLLLVDNRSYPMFAALFGYGLATIVARRTSLDGPAEARRVVRRRGWFLLLFGLVHASVLGGADVLGFYGLATLLIVGLLFRPDRALVRVLTVLCAVFTVLMPLLWIGSAVTLGGPGFPAPPAAGNYLAGVLERLLFYPAYPLMQLVGWPMIVGVLAGVWAGRRRLLERADEFRRPLTLAVRGGVAVSVLGAVPGALIVAGLWQPAPAVAGAFVALHVLTGMLGGLAYAAAFGLIGHARQDRPGPVTGALAAVGKRSLTFYVLMETLLFMVLSPSVVGLGAVLGSAGAAAVAASLWVLSLGLAVLLERAARPGPLDQLLRVLVYRPARPGSGSGTRRAEGPGRSVQPPT